MTTATETELWELLAETLEALSETYPELTKSDLWRELVALKLITDAPLEQTPELEQELASLESDAKKYVTQLKAGDYYGARETALFMHYGAQALWHCN